MYSNRWTIRAKVTGKSPVRTWSNAKGEGSFFSVDLLNASGVDVRCTFFKEAVDKFHGFLEEGRVYTFSGGRLKVANMQYNTCKSRFEITFDQNSEIHLDDTAGAAEDIRDNYNFVKIDRLEGVEPNSYVDILAVVKHVGETTSIVSKKSGRELVKCELTVEDDSGAEVRLTMWGDAAQSARDKFDGMPVVAFKRARVSDYGGRTLSGAGYEVDPNVPQARSLRQWWAANGNNGGRTVDAGLSGVSGHLQLKTGEATSGMAGYIGKFLSNECGQICHVTPFSYLTLLMLSFSCIRDFQALSLAIRRTVKAER